jgi:hypothetical protein
MAGRYSLGVRTAAAAAAGAYAAFRQLVANPRAKLVEVHIVNTGAAACAVATAAGTSSTTAAGLPEDPADVSPSTVVTIDTAWTAAPTLPTGYLRRSTLAANGGGIIWVWPEDNGAMDGGTATPLVITNPVGTGQILDITFVWDE